MNYIVTATSLRLRNGPSLTNPIITSFTLGQVLDVINQNDPDWWQVTAIVNGGSVSGYVASRFLKPAPETQPKPTLNPDNVPAVHYAISTSSKRSSVDGRHSPLSENDLPSRTVSADSRTKISEIYKIISYLDVEHSLRYQRSPQSTYCNIYAYDFCFLAQAYLPRVWWTSKTLVEFSKTPGLNPVPAYGKNVNELNANSLYDWLDEWGDDFGWTRTFDLNELQRKVNEGKIGIICAKRKVLSRSGHITCVVPEGPGHTAIRNGTQVVAPLQSQAGTKNKNFFADTWWIRLAAEFSNAGFWWHD